MGTTINNIKYLGRKFFGVRNLSTAPTYDADAQIYFNLNTAITSTADKTAINTFYLNVKSGGYYNKIKCMYFPIWLTAGNCKWNLINNRSYDLTFGTGMTFNSGGMLPNGTSAYANTQLIPSVAFSVDHNKHMSFYSRTNASTINPSSSIGSSNSTSGYCRMTIRGASNQLGYVYGGTNGTYVSTETNSLGFYMANRSTSTASQLYKNGSLIGNGNATNSTTSNIPQQLLICAAYDVSAITYYDNKQCAFASIGDSLTASEQLNFYNNVQTLMTYFGINV
jgi:hypothetical protein